MSIKYIATSSVPSSPLYSQGIAAGQFLFTSGQLGLNNSTGRLEDESFEDEFIQALENIRSILKGKMLDLDDIVKITIFITDIKQYNTLNSVYLKYFPRYKPTRSCVVVASLAKGARVEIEAVAYSDKL